jgi:hypothetical protein
MAGNTRFISFNDVKKHPDDSMLLAYLRGQKLELRSSVIQHIDLEKCPRCLQKLNELKQVSATLDALGEMRPYQHYPELSVAETYARMQNALNHRIPAKTTSNGANYRQRPRKSAVRLISVPAAFGLAILFTVAMLVFANLSGRSFIPFSVDGGTSHVQNTLTVVVQPQSTSTQEATAIVTPEAKEPHMKVCSTQADIELSHLVICGSNFDTTHKVALEVNVPGRRSTWLRNIPVDKHGKFQIGWEIASCGNVPSVIIAYEVVSARPISARLRIISFGSCPVQTPTSRAN